MKRKNLLCSISKKYNLVNITLKDTRWNMKPNKSKAIMLAKRQLAQFVCDVVNLKGINFTSPEIQTLLDGITVGGHKLTDQQIALNQAHTWRVLFELIEENHFKITVEIVCCFLHSIAARNEALEWGKFRSGGTTVTGTFLNHGYPAIDPPALKSSIMKGLDVRLDCCFIELSSTQAIC